MFDKNWNLLSGEYQGAFIRDWLAGAPATSPCSSHLARGASATASSTYDTSAVAAKSVDGSCVDSGRWMSAVGDTTPVLTINLGSYTANTRALVSTPISASIDQIRLTATDPSSTTPDIARVYEVAAH